MTKQNLSAPRVATIVGPFASGKTSLLESILYLTKKINRKGCVKEVNRVGDASKEAKDKQMSVENVIAETEYLDEKWFFIDTPGSVEFLQDTYNAMMVSDIVILCCDPDPDRVVMLTPFLKFLEERAIPHILFINKVENQKAPLDEVIQAISEISTLPLIKKLTPIKENGVITGYVDLVSERAYTYSKGDYEDNKSCHLDDVPGDVVETEKFVRQEMLEALSDYSDKLMEELLEDEIPAMDEIYEVMKTAISDGKVVPVFFGAAEQDAGVKRILKTIRHDVLDVANTKERLMIEDKDASLVFKTIHSQHTGKLSVARVLDGELKDGQEVGDGKISGLFSLFGEKTNKVSSAKKGEIVAIGKVDEIVTGDMVVGNKLKKYDDWVKPLDGLFSFAITAAKKGDEVKLSTGLHKLIEEDVSLTIEHNKDTNEMLLWGQGEIHLQVAVSKLASKFHAEVNTKRPEIPYMETIKSATKQQGRHKKQSGGAGQFGDVHVEIKPLTRGTGFEFINKIVGGVVPKSYIPAVEQGCKEYMQKGPNGYPMCDLSITLYDGSHHPVDSSEQAFKMAGIIAMKEGIPNCNPIVLEPILDIEISIPNDCTSNTQRAVSQRHGQIMGFEQKEGWQNWDVLKAQMPQAEMHDLIIELRSITMGVGSFSWAVSHLQEKV